MTSSAWLAVGAVAASLLGPGLAPGSLVLIACAVGVGVGGLRLRPGRRDGLGRAAALAPIALGVIAIALRLALTAGPVPTFVGLPDGSGPWSGSVVAVSAPREGQQVATVRLASPTIVVATTLPRFPAVEPGDQVRVDGRVEEPPDGPYGDYLARIGVDGTLRSRSLTVTGHDTDPGAQLERLRRTAGEALAAAIPEPEAGLAAGIVIGLRDRVDRDLAAAFTAVGASHVVAISGWNIAIVAATVAAFAGRLARRRRALILVAAIVTYVLFAGASASVVRAAAMAGVVLVARETGRAGRATAALGWAAALLLIADPALIGDAGFQLSTLATGGILAWANPLSERIGRHFGGRVPGWLAESLGVSLAAQAATLPVVLLTFGRLAVVSPIVNLAIVPLVAPAMAAAVVALLGGLAALAGAPGILATLAGLPAWALLTAMCTVIRAAAGLPFANVSFGRPWTFVAAAVSAALILGAPAMARWLGRRRRRRPRTAALLEPTPRRDRPKRARSTAEALAGLVAATAAFGLAFAHRADGTTRITVLDVGQGDAILGSHGERAGVRDDREGPAAKHHRRGDAAVDLRDLRRGCVAIAAEIPALERLAAVRELLAEPDDGAVDRQVVVTMEVGKGSAWSHQPDGIPQANARRERVRGDGDGAATGESGSVVRKSSIASTDCGRTERRMPVVATPMAPVALMEMATEPSVSVRSTRAPVA